MDGRTRCWFVAMPCGSELLSTHIKGKELVSACWDMPRVGCPGCFCAHAGRQSLHLRFAFQLHKTSPALSQCRHKTPKIRKDTI